MDHCNQLFFRKGAFTRTKSALLLSAFALLAGCGGGSSGGGDKDVTLAFAARVNGEAFACNRTFADVGSTGQTVQPLDLRFYVSEVELVTAEGTAVPVALTADNQYQASGVALLDFEDGSGTCTEGDSGLNSIVVGTVPDGDYTGVRFTVGVPFEQNHTDSTVAPAPLDRSAMFWNWNFGFKFVKFDVLSPGLPDGYRLHLGSTECVGNEAGPNGSCANSNRISVALNNFDPDSNTIVAEFGQLFSDSNVDVNTPATAPGCMSGPTDPECISIFPKLGLPFAGTTTAGQELFFAE